MLQAGWEGVTVLESHFEKSERCDFFRETSGRAGL